MTQFNLQPREHLPNIPNECPKREVQDYLVHLFFVFDSTVIG